MKYGCIGERLKHSFSKEVHGALADYEYEICEIPREKLEEFATGRDFKAINVTIPYKEEILPYMSHIDSHAEEIGAVNTVVNRGGELFGYNTDFYGMTMLIKRCGISMNGKKVIILGTGGTSKTALAVASSLGARECLKVSRSAKEGALSYDELYSLHTDAEVIINTTPCGMFPNIFDTPIDLSRFEKLSGVIDAIYNPLRTPLILAAKECKIPADGGLYMLIAQGVKASEIFLEKEYDGGELERVFKEILKSKENIVLIGMPASGKTTVGKILAEKLSRRLIDTDELIVKKSGMSIPEIFEMHGESTFRDIESEVIKSISSETSAIISTGGGAILRKENVDVLRENGRIYFIDRPLSTLLPTSDRPTASSRIAIEKRYNERYDIYKSAADVKVSADCTAEEVALNIIKDFTE